MTQVNITAETLLPEIEASTWRTCFPDFLICIFLLISVFIAFGPALSIGFLSDDYDHIGHVYQLLQPGSIGFIEPFIGTWRHNVPEVELYYRPLALLSYLPELYFWGINPHPYHITNLLLNGLCSCLVYFLAKRLPPLFGFTTSRLSAGFAGILFAIHPLHAETAIWIIDRLDSLNTVFVLTSFLLYERFMHSGKRSLLAFSLLSFAVALLTKEASAATPLLLLALQLTQAGNLPGIKQKLFQCRFILFHLALLAIFVLVRWHFLGCLVGGYSPVQQRSHMQLLTQPFFWQNTIFHGAYPLCDGPDKQIPFLASLFAGSYFLWGLAILFRLKQQLIENNWIRMQATTLLLAVISSLPALPIIHISAGLMGGRTVYLPSAFFFIFLGNFYLFSQHNNQAGKTSKNITLAALSLYTTACLLASWHNNQFWLETSKKTTEFAKGWEKLLLALEPGQKMLLVNPPVLHKEIHMIYMSPTLRYLAQPPFSQHHLANRIISFEPYHGLPHTLFDIDAVRELAESAHPPQFCLWNPDSGTFSLVSPQFFQENAIRNSCLQRPVFAGKRQTKNLTIYDFHCLPPLNPLTVDLLEISISAVPGNSKSGQKNVFIAPEIGEPLFQKDGSLKWGNRNPVQIKADGKTHMLRFSISEWRDLAHKAALPGFSVYVFANDNIVRLEQVNLVRIKELRPAFALKSQPRITENGKRIIDRARTPSLAFTYDASHLPGADKIQIEICPVDTWFPAYNFSYFDERKCPLGDRTTLPAALKGSVTFPLAKFKFKGEYQVRAIALNKKGKVIGYCSKPIKLVFKDGPPAPRY